MTADSWRVRVTVRGAGLPVFGPGHTRHAPSTGEGGGGIGYGTV
jgi:hypothetical protein